MARTHGFVARILGPTLYTVTLVPVLVGSVAIVYLVAGTIGYDTFFYFTTFRYNGEVADAASVLVIGGCVFGFLSQFLTRLERLRTPGLRDHLCHCGLLYVLLGTLAVPLVRMYESAVTYGLSLGDGLAVAILFTVGYAVRIDAAVLLLKRRVGQHGLGGNA